MPRTSHLRTFRAMAERAYTRTFDRFSITAAGIGTTVTPLVNGKCFAAELSTSHSNAVEVTGVLRLERLPSRRRDAGHPSPRDRGICVLLSSFDVYKFAGRPAAGNSYLNHSNVRIGYYEPMSDRWKSLLCVRYDYGSTGARHGHPIFHAQMELGPLDADLQAKFPGVPTIEPLGRTCHHARIPTANVIGATALVKLAADHLPPIAFPQILDSVTSQAFFKDWRCNCTSLDDPESAKRMISTGWYSTR